MVKISIAKELDPKAIAAIREFIQEKAKSARAILEEQYDDPRAKAYNLISKFVQIYETSSDEQSADEAEINKKGGIDIELVKKIHILAEKEIDLIKRVKSELNSVIDELKKDCGALEDFVGVLDRAEKVEVDIDEVTE